jgi:hypothetical protein
MSEKLFKFYFYEKIIFFIIFLIKNKIFLYNIYFTQNNKVISKKIFIHN